MSVKKPRSIPTGTLNDEEREAMDHLVACIHIISSWSENENGAFANTTELTMGVHTIQQFIIQHMLTRQRPDNWANWWKKLEDNN